MDNRFVTPDMRERGTKFIEAMNREFPGMYEKAPLQPTLALCEEVGEFAGAMRRLMKLARRSGTRIEAMDELADVVICAHVAAQVYGFDLEDAIARKWDTIFSRGFREQPAAGTPAYVYDILRAWNTGQPLDFQGHEVPGDVQAEIERIVKPEIVPPHPFVAEQHSNLCLLFVRFGRTCSKERNHPIHIFDRGQ
jgi:NTP pyrophosphatase (non-canonical NTP hydrolase)